MIANTFKYLLVEALLAATLGCSDTTTQPLPPDPPFVPATQPPTPSPTPAPAPVTQPGLAITQGQLVYYDIDSYYGIFVASPEGSQLTRLSPVGALDIDPAISRDGKRIAYSNALPNGNAWNIYVMNADGSNRSRVTSLPESNDRPAWSPDGKRIVFESTADHMYNQVYVVNSDGTGVTQLTFAKGNSGAPDWSPDGSRIVFDRDVGIFSMNPDGTEVRQLTFGHFDKEPAWSPDGKHVTFVRDVDGARELFVTDADGSGTRKLTSGIGTVSDPSWAPDGKTIAFGITSSSKMCVDEYGDGISLYPCGHDFLRVDLNGSIDPQWVLRSAYNAAWQQ